MEVAEKVTLGLDIGIGSIGWILIEEQDDKIARLFTRTLKDGSIMEAAGVRLVNVPEDAKTKELLSQHRRSAKRQRVTIRRRAQRMRLLRELLASKLYPAAADVEQMHHSAALPQISPWQLRKKALTHLLSDRELAIILVHMAMHRGFLSNSKKDKSDKSSDTGKMLQAISAMEQQIKKENYPTIGAFLADKTKEIRQGDKVFTYGLQRNRSGMDGKPEYSYTAQRKLLAEEADLIFSQQREFGNHKASPEFLERYKELAFEQRPLKSVEGLIGPCSFMEGEKRAPKYAPTAEKFRLVQKLCNLRLALPNGEKRTLTELERRSVLSLLGKQKGISYIAVRKKLALDAGIRFDDLNYNTRDKNNREVDPEKGDIVTRSGACAPGYAVFREVLGEDLFGTLLEERTPNRHRLLDEISKIISDNDDKEEIQTRLKDKQLKLHDNVIDTLMQAVENGKFSEFRGVINLSLKAMEAIIPQMLQCGDYAKACELAGFDHTKTQPADWNNVKNPLVQHMLREVRKQVETIVHEFDVIPGRVHIETARDLGKSVEDRNKMKSGQDENRSRNQRTRKKLEDLFDRAPSAEELKRYQLWEQQDGKCCYYMLWRKAGGAASYSAKGAAEGSIQILQLRDGLNEVQVDHILPYSRTCDSSFHNLGLCISAANQNKGNRSPYEWVGQNNPQSWHEFKQWVEHINPHWRKKSNYLLQDLTEKEETFSTRNLNDTRYICRVIMDWLTRDFYSEHGVMPEYDENGREKRRVFARPGKLTAHLRKQWGLESLKKDTDKPECEPVNGGTADSEGGTADSKSKKNKTKVKRINDKHHALDAFVVACCSEGMLQKITAASKRKEVDLLSEKLPEPMPNCRIHMEAMLDKIFPSRAEEGKISGALHEETLRAIVKERDSSGNEVTNLYLKTPIAKLTLEDLDKIKDAERCPDIIRPLRQWLEERKRLDEARNNKLLDEAQRKLLDEEWRMLLTEDKLPRSDVTGFPIKKVKLRLKDSVSSGMILRRGKAEAQAANGSMVRTDVFTKADKYYLVPVYAWQLAQGLLPNKAIAAHKPESEWPEMDSSYEFKFSLYPNNYLLLEKGKHEILEGYYVTTDRSGGTLTISPAYDKQQSEQIRGIGARNLKSLRKFRVDRLGRLHEVKKEKRTLK